MLKNILIVFLLFYSSTNAKELEIAFLHSSPPYTFKDGSGIALDIVQEALAYNSYSVKPAFINIGRSIEMFKYGYIDATSIIKKGSGLKAYYSEYFIQYHNAVFALKSNNYNIKNINDIKKYYCISFENATKYLGEEFKKTAKDSRRKYSEVTDQKHQVYKLLHGRTDIVVMDKHIFKFYKDELIKQGEIPTNIEVDIFDFFEPTKYRTAFKDKNVRDNFNDGIRKLKKSGRYDEIYAFYSNKYFKVKQ